MSKQLDQLIGTAIEQGLLAGASVEAQRTARPWPVIVMTAVAAWFAAIPLGVLVGLVFFSGNAGSTTAFALALPLLSGAVLVLRSRAALFLEQLALAGLIIGVALVAIALHDSSSSVASYTAVALLTFCLGFSVPQNWLRMLLGAAGTRVAAEALMKLDYSTGIMHLSTTETWQVLTVCWLAAHAALARCERIPARLRLAAALEALLSGAGAMIVLMLAYGTGRTFLFNTDLPENFWDSVPGYHTGTMASVVLGLVACARLAQQWPAMRSIWFAGTAAIVALLCYLCEPLGAVLLVVGYSATSGRQRLAVLAGAAALWIVGASYYQMSWPLVYKGSLLLVSGLALGAVARFLMPAAAPGSLVPAPQPAEVLPAQSTRWARGWIAASAVFALVFANALIWQKETVIRLGQPVFVELAPVDPRSLMQGDYMQLSFAFPAELWQSDTERMTLVARRAPNGVATLMGRYVGKPLSTNELLIKVVRKNDRWMVVTDAWYFAEGEAERWAQARYGEFRVDADGKALLVGLRGKNLEAL